MQIYFLTVLIDHVSGTDIEKMQPESLLDYIKLYNAIMNRFLLLVSSCKKKISKIMQFCMVLYLETNVYVLQHIKEKLFYFYICFFLYIMVGPSTRLIHSDGWMKLY